MTDPALDISQARVIMALNVLVGNVKPTSWTPQRRLDEEEIAILESFNECRKWGWGEVRVTIAGNHLDTLYHGRTRKRKDLLNI